MDAPQQGLMTLLASRAAERERMIADQLVAGGVRSPRVLQAIRDVPRELFVPGESSHVAYADCALAIQCGQTISQPFVVAKMSEMLELEPHHRVLEIGSGSGYQTAILAHLCAEVFSVEWHAELAELARRRLSMLGIDNARQRIGDGSLGWQEFAPYDRILVAAGAPDVPDPLVQQLVVGGILIIPTGSPHEQVMVRLVLTASGVQMRVDFPCRFVPLLGAHGRH